MKFRMNKSFSNQILTNINCKEENLNSIILIIVVLVSNFLIFSLYFFLFEELFLFHFIYLIAICIFYISMTYIAYIIYI